MTNSHTTRASTSPFSHWLALSSLLLPLLLHPAHAADDTINPDRPDFVDSSDVVGRGHVQVETGFASERGTADGVRSRLSSTPVLLRFGVSDTFELRVETDGWLHQRTDGPGAAMHTRDSGYADASLGVKWHGLDAAGNAPSLGVILHADLDSGSAPFRGDGIRPSLHLAAEWDLPADMSLGVMPGLSWERNAEGQRYTNALLGVVLDKSWGEHLRSFVEVSAPQIARARNGGSTMSFDTGVAYLLSRNCQVDAAVSHGLNRRTPDLSWTMGVSFKM